MSADRTAIDLYWLPLGAGGRSVRLNGRLFEAVAAALGHRRACDLYHSALEARVPEGRFVIEMAPIPVDDAPGRGVVAEGAVGAGVARRLRLFRYEVRCWLDGVIPDVAEAVESPRRLSNDPDCTRRLLELVPHVPTPVWGRDELRTGEMWNSNSLISWLITRCGLDIEPINPPTGGRAPGWRAGIAVARRQQTSRSISQEMNEFEFHISPVRSSSRPHIGVGTAAPVRAAAACAFGVVARPLRALDGLGNIGDDAVAPAAHLVAEEPEAAGEARCRPGLRRPRLARRSCPMAAPARSRTGPRATWTSSAEW